MIAALLLAAGASRRFGGTPKLVEELNGKPIVRWSAEALMGAPIDEIIAVVPPDHEAIRSALTALDVRFAVNSRHELGIGSSIACGASALKAHTEVVLVALGDEPTLSHDAVLRVIEHYRTERLKDVHIVAPTYRGVRGHPTLFDRAVVEELRSLSGDRGARDVVDRDRSRVAFLEFDRLPPGDIDTPDDLARARRQAQYIPPPTLQRS